MMDRQAKVRHGAGKVLLLVAWLVLCGAAQAATRTTVTYVYTNVQGTPLARADAQGNVIARYSYRPYGTQQSGPTHKGPGYTGHVDDPDTGLVYMQQRYYDPAVGRFISPDPVAPTSGNIFNFGRYTYANNNPIVNIDPDGRLSSQTSPPKDCGEEPCVDPPPPPPPPTNLAPVTVTATTIALTPGQLDLLELGKGVLHKAIAVPNPWVVLAVGLVYPRPIADSTCSGTHACVMMSLGEDAPADAPQGTIPLNKAKGKFGITKDNLHKIKDQATGGGRQGKAWVGVDPATGDVGVNENGHWSPEGTASELLP